MLQGSSETLFGGLRIRLGLMSSCRSLREPVRSESDYFMLNNIHSKVSIQGGLTHCMSVGSERINVAPLCFQEMEGALPEKKRSSLWKRCIDNDELGSPYSKDFHDLPFFPPDRLNSAPRLLLRVRGFPCFFPEPPNFIMPFPCLLLAR